MSETRSIIPGYRPSSRTLNFRGEERKYFVALPKEFDPDRSYWPLVFVHGGGGNARTNRKAISLRRIADEMHLPAIMIIPEFITRDKQVSRFPSLGEGAYLKSLLGKVHGEFELQEKILLSGYSMGGQFSHRFALLNPGMVQACAAFAAGTWSTPDGRMLIEGYGEVRDPGSFLSNRENILKVPERLHDIFDTRTAEIADLPAEEAADGVPFLVMCGTMDTRYGIALKFASSLRERGFKVETAWPRTPHTSNSDKYRAEFEKYSERAIRFFLTHAAGVR